MQLEPLLGTIVLPQHEAVEAKLVVGHDEKRVVKQDEQVFYTGARVGRAMPNRVLSALLKGAVAIVGVAAVFEGYGNGTATRNF